MMKIRIKIWIQMRLKMRMKGWISLWWDSVAAVIFQAGAPAS